MFCEVICLFGCFRIIQHFYEDFSLNDATHARVISGFSIGCMMVIALGLTLSIFNRILSSNY